MPFTADTVKPTPAAPPWLWAVLGALLLLGAGGRVAAQPTYPLNKADSVEVSYKQQLQQVAFLLSGGRSKPWRLAGRLVGPTHQDLYPCEVDDTLIFRSSNVTRLSSGPKRCSLLDPDYERGYWQYMPTTQRLILSNENDMYIYQLIKLTADYLKIKYYPPVVPEQDPEPPITLIFKPY